MQRDFTNLSYIFGFVDIANTLETFFHAHLTFAVTTESHPPSVFNMSPKQQNFTTFSSSIPLLTPSFPFPPLPLVKFCAGFYVFGKCAKCKSTV